MTPQQLLLETQKAAGDPNLSSWFETLKDEGKQLKLAQQVHCTETILTNVTHLVSPTETERGPGCR